MMAKVTKLFSKGEDGIERARRIGFKCPGCDNWHWMGTAEFNDDQAVWGFNGNFDKPTFTPSILSRGGHYIPNHQPGASCWCKPSDPEYYDETGCYVCHSFVTDGKIQFLGDCTHKLAGQTVELPEIDPT